MTTVTCDIRDCKELAPYECDMCGSDMCAYHAIAGEFWNKDADDYGFKVDENGKEHCCRECMQ
jgi:hypothetical protein